MTVRSYHRPASHRSPNGFLPYLLQQLPIHRDRLSHVCRLRQNVVIQVFPRQLLGHAVLLFWTDPTIDNDASGASQWEPPFWARLGRFRRSHVRQPCRLQSAHLVVLPHLLLYDNQCTVLHPCTSRESIHRVTLVHDCPCLVELSGTPSGA
ncbi:hypothetical protein FKP32DRAFT_1404399 [Trametes sanguinea]|nr:hypothetical protein FKP32DRAFT_1404399 [Trametes sanguinea]